MWIYLLLGILLVTGFGLSLYMSAKSKRPTATEFDYELLADLIGKAVAREFNSISLSSPSTRRGSLGYDSVKEEDEILMDERIIPVAIRSEVTESNLENMSTVETQQDGKAKGALAKLKALKGKQYA